MFFYMPVHVYSEPYCITRHADALARLGKRALIVTGASSAKRNGSLQDTVQALEEKGVTWCLFDQVEENPSTDTVMKARDFGLSEQADFVIGIGGGSPMDAAKAIALMMQHPAEDASYMEDKEKDSGRLPLALIPTTCGTGSEVTAVSVLTRKATSHKSSIPHRIFADLAFLDGRYLQMASPSILANTTMDTFAHLVESYINTASTLYVRAIIDQGLSLWRKNKDIVLGQRQATEEDFFTMLNASMCGGMAIAHAGTTVPHGLSYALTLKANMPHGKACGYFMKGYLDEASKEDRNHILSLAGFKDTDDFLAYYRATCGMETIATDILESSIQDVLKTPAKLAAVPYTMNESVLRRIVFY
jgi:alcohol dehydrogenase